MSGNLEALQVSSEGVLPHPGRDLASSVAAELEPLFGRSPPLASDRRVAHGQVEVVAPPAEPARLAGIAKIGTIGAALLAGMVLGTVLLPKVGLWRDPPAVPTPVIAAASVAPAPADIAPPVPSGADAPIDRPVIILPSTPGAGGPASDRAQRVEARPRSERAQASRQRAARAERCSVGDRNARARCLWPEVVRADRRLRLAYNRAVEAGVARSVLVSHRSQWDRMRRQAVRDPRQLISEYARMAKSLEEARDRL